MKKLAGLRVTAGLTQLEVAKALGVSQGAVSLWESGDGNPKIDKIPIIAKLYGVTEQDIINACISAAANNIIPQEGAKENV